MNRNLFNSIRITKPKRNVFDLSHDVKLSVDMGYLYPIMAMDVVPGDKFEISCESLLRFQPLVAPVMQRMDVFFHYFFVPNRLLWDKWGDWIAGNIPNPHPYTEMTTYDNLPLADYLGLPEAALAYYPNALPFAAYQCIYNEYYRDQNLVAPVDYKLADGPNTLPDDFTRLGTIRKRAWMHDYFTAALPWAQKGDSVALPVGTFPETGLRRDQNTGDGASFVMQGVSQPGATAGTGTAINANSTTPLAPGALYVPETDLGNTTINDLRRAFRLQEWLEKNARAGTRYVESILAHFGVRSSDARLQRPEYITGSKSPVVVSEVLNTTGEDGGLPQGNMAGHGISVTSGKQGSYYCEEHGWIIGIMSVMPVTAYQQGVPRSMLRGSGQPGYTDRFQYFWPEFANIGEQEISILELYADAADQSAVFGYNPRYSEYKYMPSRVCGDMRSSLDFWHLGRIFETEPTLSQEFIECTPGKRIFAVTEEDQNSLVAHVYNRVKAIRPMPKFGTPAF